MDPAKRTLLKVMAITGDAGGHTIWSNKDLIGHGGQELRFAVIQERR